MRDGKEMKCKRCGANENRIHGFCSMECETAWEYEDEIRDLTTRIAELTECIGSQMADVYTLKARIAELEAAQRWRVVADGELPEFGTSILFYDSILEKINKGTCTALDRDKTNLQWITDDGLYYHGNRCEYITHWMPLPQLPEVQQ